MILSAGTRKSISDLTRRRARAFFVVATLALAVASISIRAMPALLNRAMNAEVAASRLANVTITTKPLVLTAGQIRALRRLPNVTAFEPRSTFSTAVYIGARRQKAFLIGRASFAHQSVDVVTVSAGAAPGFGAALTDVENAADGGYVLAGDEDIEQPEVTIEPWIAKVSSSGSLLWQHLYYQVYSKTGLPLSEDFSGAAVTSAGGFVAVGPTEDYATQKEELYAVQTDSSGNAGTCRDEYAGPPLQPISPDLTAAAPSLPVQMATTIAVTSPIATTPTSIRTQADC